MNPIPILMYHNIDHAPRNTKGRGLYVSKKKFALQMWLLKQMKFQGLSMAAAMPYLRGEKTGKIAIITLDDGYLDNVKHALPILKSHGFSATCYLVSQHVGSYNAWDADLLKIRKPLMDWQQATEWLLAGMEIGAHSRTHRYLTSCSNAELENEIIGCKQDLETKLSTNITQFSYPYGDWDERVTSVVKRAGFLAATTTKRGRAQIDKNLFALPRINMKGSKGWRVFLFS